MITELNVMIFCTPVKWAFKFLKNNAIFWKFNIMLCLLFRIFLPHLEFDF